MPRPERLAGRAGGPLARGLLLLGLLWAGPVLAHRLSVFASAEGALISGSAWFVGGRPARGVQVRVLGPDDQVLTTLTPDQDGRFRFQANAAVDHRIVVEGADGHRAEWVIHGPELAGAFGGQAAVLPGGAGTGAGAAGPDGTARPAAAAAVPADLGLSAATLAAVEAAVARQVRPLREELAAAEDRIRLRDVLGGLGWLAGWAGLGAWWAARRRSPTPSRSGDQPARSAR